MTAVAAGAVLLVAVMAWTNRNYIDSYLTNDIGAPEVTAEARQVGIDAGELMPELEREFDAEPEAEAEGELKGESERELEVSPVRIAVAGDVGTGEAEAYRTAEVMDSLDQQYEFAALLLLGDNIYPEGEIDQLQEKLLDPFAPVLDGDTRLLPVLGNHDVDYGYREAQIEAFSMPGAWYSEMIGENTLFIGLDSNQADNPEQLVFLEDLLKGERPAWTIVTMHHPAFSAGHHGDEPSVQKYFVPLFEKYGVTLVLAGHDHDYQRSVPINGITYVVSGAAAYLRPAGRNEFTEVSWSTYSFVDLVVYPDRIEAQAIDHEGRAIDSFDLR